MHLIDFIIFLVFTLGVVVFGCSFFKKGSSADEFTSAGHSIPGWVVGMSIFATYVSSISLSRQGLCCRLECLCLFAQHPHSQLFCC